MRRLVLLVLLAGLVSLMLVPALSGATGQQQGRGPQASVAVYQLADAAGEGPVRGLAIVVQRGKVVRWWLSGFGLTAGLHAQHIHGPGPCEANAPIILGLPDVEVQADGSFFASGQTRSERRIAGSSALNYWNIHERSSEAGAGPGVMCGERRRVSLGR